MYNVIIMLRYMYGFYENTFKIVETGNIDVL